jgi:hypothetical protein
MPFCQNRVRLKKSELRFAGVFQRLKGNSSGRSPVGRRQASLDSEAEERVSGKKHLTLDGSH